MKINDALISRLEQLAELDLPEADRQRLRQDLQAMVDMVGKLSDLELDDAAIKGADYPVPAWRKDRAEGPADQKNALDPAPDQKEGLFAVPRVIDPMKKKK